MSVSSGASGTPLPRPWLVALVALTAVASLEKVVGLSAPLPKAEAPSTLRLAGYRLSALPSLPPRRGRELSQGTSRRFRLTPLSGGEPLTLTLLPVRSRTATDLSAETMGGKGLSMETVAAVVPGFALKQPRLVNARVVQGGEWSALVDQLLVGHGPGDPAGSTTRLQTCLTPTGQALVKATSLANHTDPPQQLGEPSPGWRRLLRLAGLAPVRHECLAVQLTRGRAAGDETRLQMVWWTVRNALLTGT